MSDPLQNLGHMAAEADAENPTPEQRALATQDDNAASELEKGAREWAFIPLMLGSSFAMLAPELKQVYSEQACLQWGEAAHLVAKKYGWNAPGAPEFALAAGTINLAVPTFLLLRQRLQDMREGKEAGLFGKLVLWWKYRRERRQAAASRSGKAGADQAQDVQARPA